MHSELSTTMCLARLQDAAMDNMVKFVLSFRSLPLTPADFDKLTRLQHQTPSKDFPISSVLYGIGRRSEDDFMCTKARTGFFEYLNDRFLLVSLG